MTGTTPAAKAKAAATKKAPVKKTAAAKPATTTKKVSFASIVDMLLLISLQTAAKPKSKTTTKPASKPASKAKKVGQFLLISSVAGLTNDVIVSRSLLD